LYIRCGERILRQFVGRNGPRLYMNVRNTIIRNLASIDRTILDFIRRNCIVRDFYICYCAIGYAVCRYCGIHNVLCVDYSTAVHFKYNFHPFYKVFIGSLVSW